MTLSITRPVALEPTDKLDANKIGIFVLSSCLIVLFLHFNRAKYHGFVSWKQQAFGQRMIKGYFALLLSSCGATLEAARLAPFAGNVRFVAHCDAPEDETLSCPASKTILCNDWQVEPAATNAEVLRVPDHE
eukprot:693245-Amphidinium_carterae.1